MKTLMPVLLISIFHSMDEAELERLVPPFRALLGLVVFAAAFAVRVTRVRIWGSEDDRAVVVPLPVMKKKKKKKGAASGPPPAAAYAAPTHETISVTEYDKRAWRSFAVFTGGSLAVVVVMHVWLSGGVGALASATIGSLLWLADAPLVKVRLLEYADEGELERPWEKRQAESMFTSVKTMAKELSSEQVQRKELEAEAAELARAVRTLERAERAAPRPAKGRR